MANTDDIDGSVFGTLFAGGFTLLAGTVLPLLFTPESTMTPVLGILCAVPAGILGALLGSFIERKELSLLQSILVGAVPGASIPGVIVLLTGATLSQGLAASLVAGAIPALIFGATGALVQVLASRSRRR